MIIHERLTRMHPPHVRLRSLESLQLTFLCVSLKQPNFSRILFKHVSDCFSTLSSTLLQFTCFVGSFLGREWIQELINVDNH